MLLSCCAMACAAPPGGESPRDEGAVAVEQLGSDPAPEVAPEHAPEHALELDADDPLLARARTRVRGGRVAEEVRRELVESADPDHRHAARLLQAIAGEEPAAVLARTGAVAVEVAVAEELFEPEAELEPQPRPQPAEPVEPHQVAVATEPIDRVPKLSAIPIGSPAWAWFATGLVIVEPPREELVIEPTIDLESIVGPLPLLLRERPPMPAAPKPVSGDGPRLVILTSLALRPGSTPNEATLELAGAGAAKLSAQPMTSNRVRLWVLDAGAVPGFVSARPTAPGLAVVDVARRDRTLEIELELASGWALQSVTTLDNGASVRFAKYE